MDQEPALANDIFLDVDPVVGLRPGERWKDRLQQANAQCEAVVCLLSRNWAASHECKVEYRLAETLNKQILCARLEPSAGDELTDEWQRCDLFGDGPTTPIDVKGGPPVTFLTEGLYRLRDAIRGAGLSAQSFIWPPRSDPDRGPYRGWEPLDQVDAAVFFGRDAAIVRALDDLRGMRTAGTKSLFVVLGPSGTGKSSFLRAGILPRLAREDRRFSLLGIVRPGRNALTGDTGLSTAMWTARERLGLTSPSPGYIKKACGGDGDRVVELLREIQEAAAARLPITDEPGEYQAPPTLVLPVDQAEELFSADAGAQGGQLLSLIRHLASTDLSLIVIATIRTDRYEVMQTHPELIGVGTTVFDDLKPMPSNQFREVITGPAERASRAGQRVAVAPDLVDRLIDEAAEGADTLPLLALTLARLYADYASTGELTVQQYEDMGEMDQVVQSEIDDALAADPDERRRQLDCLRSAFIPWLATINPENDQPMRRVAKYDDLPEDSRPLIDALVAKRLMVKDMRDGQVVVEVALESFLRQWDELAGWLREQRHELKLADDLERGATAWRNSGADPAWLLTGTRLAEAESLVASTAFAQLLAAAREYLATSRQAENERLAAEEEHREAELRNAQERQATAEAQAATLKKRSRITRALLAVTAVIAVIAVVFGVVFVRKNAESNDRFRDAASAKLVAQVQELLDRPGNESQAFQLVLAAYGIAKAPAQAALYNTVVKNRATSKIDDAGGEVYEVAPDGGRAVVADGEDSVRVLDIGSGRAVGSSMKGAGQDQNVKGATISRDGKRIVLATGSAKYLSVEELSVWEGDTGKRICELAKAAGSSSITFSWDGMRVAAANQDGSVRIWDSATCRLLDRFDASRSPDYGAYDANFSPDGARLAVTDVDGVRIWDLAKREPLGPAFSGGGEVNATAFDYSGGRIVVAEDNTVRIWDANSGKAISDPLKGHDGDVSIVAFSSDGKWVASGGKDKTVRLWDAETGKAVGGPLVGHGTAITRLAFLDGGKKLVSADGSNSLRTWDPEVELPSFAPHDPDGSAALSKDGERVAISYLDGKGTVAFVDTGTGAEMGRLKREPNARFMTAMAWSADGRHLAATPYGGADQPDTVQLWSVDSGQLDGPPIRMAGRTTGMTFSTDGELLASQSYDNAYNDFVEIVDVNKHQLVGAPLPVPTTALAFNPDGRLLVGTKKGTVQYWDPRTGKSIGGPVVGHTDAVLSIAFSPNGRDFATASSDKTIRLWDAASGKPVGDNWTGSSQGVRTVAFSPNSAMLAAGGSDGSTSVWTVATVRPAIR